MSWLGYNTPPPPPEFDAKKETIVVPHDDKNTRDGQGGRQFAVFRKDATSVPIVDTRLTFSVNPKIMATPRKSTELYGKTTRFGVMNPVTRPIHNMMGVPVMPFPNPRPMFKNNITNANDPNGAFKENLNAPFKKVVP
jgi:hypothetical protein